ncbi:MAG: YqjK-like family protein [Rhodocyclaceae bacterium]|nr:YqjK-like family protein [Rhodocyclaceae bacterium]
MNPHCVELALRKQRLQWQSAALRNDFAHHAATLAPVIRLADSLREGFRWIGQHPFLPVVGGVALLVIQPKRALRWARRGWSLWALWRKITP